MMYYSASANGFCHEPIFSDSVPIPMVDYNNMLSAQSSGSRIVPGENGLPRLMPPSELTRQDLIFKVSLIMREKWRGGFPLFIGGIKKWFHSDEFSLTQHLGLKDKARDLLASGGSMADSILIAGQPIFWSTMDGSLVPITAQVAFNLVDGAALQQALVFAASGAHRQAISVAADVTNYDVTANWPEVFES